MSFGELAAEISLDDTLVLGDLIRQTPADKLTMVEHQNAVGKRKHYFHQVFDNHYRNAARRYIADQIQGPGDFGRVEPGVYFIE